MPEEQAPVADVSESPSPPPEPQQDVSEPAETPVSQNANRRIQELNREKKQQEERARRLEKQVQDLQSLYQQQFKQSQTPKQPARDSEAENIIHELGGDDTARKLYDVLSRTFGHAAKKGEYVSKAEAEQMMKSVASTYFGGIQSSLAVSNSVNALVQAGTLDDKEAQWVTSQVSEIAKGNPQTLTNPKSASMLVNMVLGQGFTSGEIKPGKKTRGTPTVVGPGRNSTGGTQDPEFKDIKAAASRFRTLAGLDDKSLKALRDKVST